MAKLRQFRSPSWAIMKSAVKAKWDFLRKEMAERASEFGGKDIFEQFKLQAEIGLRFAPPTPSTTNWASSSTRKKETQSMKSSSINLEMMERPSWRK